MPIYTYRCDSCDSTFDVVRKIAEMQKEELHTCGKMAQKIIVPWHVMPDLPSYTCPITGEWIDGRKAHKENLKRKGCRVFEPGELEHFKKSKDERQKDFDRRTEQIVENAARTMGLIS